MWVDSKNTCLCVCDWKKKKTQIWEFNRSWDSSSPKLDFQQDKAMEISYDNDNMISTVYWWGPLDSSVDS